MTKLLCLPLICCLVGAAAAWQDEQDDLPPTLYVKNSPSQVSIADGSYTLTDNIQNGQRCYNRDRTDLWLCRDAHNLWSFQPLNFRGSAQGIMVSTQKGSPTPLGTGPWRIWKDGKWEAVSTTLSDESPAVEAAPITDDQRLVKETIAGMLFGFAVLGMLAMSLTGSTDEHIRSWSFKLVGATFTFLIALLIVQAVWDLLMEQLFPAPFPRGIGLSYPVKPGIKIITSFILFSLSCFFLNGLAWKFQLSRSRLMVIKTLGAHVTAILGIMAFTLIQHEAVFEVALAFRGDLLSAETTRAIVAFLVILLAWLTFATYRWASMGLRQETLRQAPVHPWGTTNTWMAPVVVAAPPSRSCANPWGAAAPASSAMSTDAAVGDTGPSWGSIVNDAEDEAATVVIGFLASQAIMFCKTGELPGFKGHYTHNDDDRALLFFAIGLAVLVLLFVIILAIRSKQGHGGRPGRICQRSTAMAFTWMLYRATCWNTRVNMMENRPLALAVAALVICILCTVALLIIDKALDSFFGRTGSSTMRSWAGYFTGPGEITLQEMCMRVIMSCMGLTMALSWQLNFEEAVATVVQSVPFLAKHVVLSQSLLCILLALAMCVPWRRFILPKSEMREATHLDEIKYELSILNDAESFMP